MYKFICIKVITDVTISKYGTFEWLYDDMKNILSSRDLTTDIIMSQNGNLDIIP